MRQHKQALASLKFAASGNADFSEVLRDKALTVQTAFDELLKPESRLLLVV